MEPQVLEKSSVTVSQEIKQEGFTEYINDEKLSTSSTSVVIIRWLTVLFCLACWYGIFTVIKFLIRS